MTRPAAESTPSVAGTQETVLPVDFHPPEKHTLGWLSRRVLRRMVALILPRNERMQVPVVDEMVNFVENYLRYLPPLLRMGFPIGILLFQLGGIIWGGRLVPFTWLSEQRQETYLRGWVYSRFWWKRDLLKGVKGLVLLGFYQHPAVMQCIGYDPAGHATAMKTKRFNTVAHQA